MQEKVLCIILIGVLALVLPAMGNTATYEQVNIGDYVISFDPQEKVQLIKMDHLLTGEGVLFYGQNNSDLFGAIAVLYFCNDSTLLSMNYSSTIPVNLFGKEYTAIQESIAYRGGLRNVTEVIAPLETTYIHQCIYIIVDSEDFDRIVATVKVEKKHLIVTIPNDYYLITFDAGPGAIIVKNTTFEDDGVIINAVKFRRDNNIVGVVSVGPRGPINCTAKMLTMISGPEYGEVSLSTKKFHDQELIAVTAFDKVDGVKQNLTGAMIPIDQINVLTILVSSSVFDEVLNSIQWTKKS